MTLACNRNDSDDEGVLRCPECFVDIDDCEVYLVKSVYGQPMWSFHVRRGKAVFHRFGHLQRLTQESRGAVDTVASQDLDDADV